MSVVENTPVNRSYKKEKSARKSSFISKLFKFGKNITKSSKKENNDPSQDFSESKTETPNLNNHPSISYNHNIDSKVVKSINFNSENKRVLSSPNGVSKLFKPVTPKGDNQIPCNIPSKRLNYTLSGPSKILDSNIIPNSPKKQFAKSNSDNQPTTTNINVHPNIDIPIIINNYDINKFNDINNCNINTNNNNNNLEISKIQTSALYSNTTADVHNTTSQTKSHKIHTYHDNNTNVKKPDDSILIHYSTSKDTCNNNSKNNNEDKDNNNEDKDNNKDNNDDKCPSRVPYHISTSEYSTKNEVAIDDINMPNINNNINANYNNNNNVNYNNIRNTNKNKTMNMHNNEANGKTYVRIDLVTYNKLLNELTHLKTQLSQLQVLLT